MFAYSALFRPFAGSCWLSAVLLLSACSEAPATATETVRPVKTMVVTLGTGSEKLVQTVFCCKDYTYSSTYVCLLRFIPSFCWQLLVVCRVVAQRLL